MNEDKNLAIDESRRIEQHEAVKGEVRSNVHREIADNADRLDTSEQSALLADRLKERAVVEVSDTEAELDRAKTITRISQVIDYIFCLIYGIIGIEIVLDLVGA